MYNKLFSRLLNTRDSLKNACYDLSIDLSSVDLYILEDKVVSCVNCRIWLPSKQFVIEDDMPVCHFCADMDTLRF